MTFRSGTQKMSGDALDLIDELSLSQKADLISRYDELTSLGQKQVQFGTTVPQLYGSMARFIANPSTVSCETFKRMLDTDDTLGSGIDFMNLCMIARFGDYKHKSPEITEFIKTMLDRMEGSWHENLQDMFSAEWAGFSISEPVWTFDNDFNGLPAFVPKKVVTYPPLTFVFSVDRHGELHENGIHQYQRYYNTYINSYAGGIRSDSDMGGFRPDLFSSLGDLPYPVRVSADLSYLTVKMSRQKVIHIRGSAAGAFKNPYGRSLFRRAYKHWVAKDAFLKMWIVAADRKGTPLVVAYVAPNETVRQDTRNGGEGPRGEGKVMRADQAMAETLRNIHNSSFVIVPGKKGETAEIDSVDITGDMNIFQNGMQYFDTRLMRCLLIPPLIMGGDGGGSYSLGQEHHKIFSRCIDGKLKPYKQGIIDQFISKAIKYNFPESAWKRDGFGGFAIEEFDIELMDKLSTIFTNLTDKGYMSPEDQQDMDEVRQKMGLKKKKASALYTEGDPVDPVVNV